MIPKLRATVLIICGAAVVTLVLSACYSIGAAHAQGAPPPAEPVLAGEWRPVGAALANDTAVWLLGALVVLKILELLLARVAPLTKTKWDDNALAAVHGLRDAVAEFMSHARPATTVVVAPVNPPPTPRDPPGPPGRTEGGMLAVLALTTLVGLLALSAGALSGCATVDRAGDAAKPAVVDCAKQYGPGVAAAVARWGAESVIAGRVDWDAIEAQAKALGIGVGGCAVFAFYRAWKTAPRVDVAVRAVAGPADVVAQGQAVLARLSAAWGGATWVVP